MNLDPAKPYADLIRWVVALVLVALLLFAGHRWGASTWKDKHADAVAKQERLAAVIGELADKTAEVARRAKAASGAVRKSRAAIDKQHREELDDAKRREDSLRADLRAGSRRLQPWWDCGPPGPGAGDVAADAGEADAGRRADSAARIVGAAERDAAVIGWLWDSWKADRDAVIAAGCAVEAR